MFRLGSLPLGRAALIGFALLSIATACSNFGSSPGPTQVVTPTPATPSPPPQLFISPSTLTFSKGQTSTQQVTIFPPNLSYYNIGTPSDTCAPNIAIAKPSPAPTSTPQGSFPPQVYNVTPGSKNGSCAIEFEDFSTGAVGTLKVKNNSNT